MNFKIVGVNAPKASLHNGSKVSFQRRADVIEFSSTAKEKTKILNELNQIGLEYDKAQEMIKEYYDTDEYNALINGEYDEIDQKYYPVHFVDKDDNLTPTEAILYLAYDMKEYYLQGGDWGTVIDNTSIKAKDYDLGNSDFSPVELAKNMVKGYDIVLSGMMVKGRLDSKTAERLKPYYEASRDQFDEKENLKEAEYTAHLLSQNFDILDYWTSDEKDDEGNYKNGLTRPLTKEEAVILVKDDYLPRDTKSLNNYIEMNREFGYSLYRMDLDELWDVDVETLKEIQAQRAKVVKIPRKVKIQNLTEAINAAKERCGGQYEEFFSDITALDNDKFFKRYPISSIKYDALTSFTCTDRELRQKNIQVLNSASEELLNKMTSGKVDKRGVFPLLGNLFKVEDLDLRIQQMEEYKNVSPWLFDSMTKGSLMDYLTNSHLYTEQEENLKNFYDILSGREPDETGKRAEIIELPKNQD